MISGENRSLWPAPDTVRRILFDVSLGGHHPDYVSHFLRQGGAEWDLIVTSRETVEALSPEHRQALESHPHVLVFPGWEGASFAWSEVGLVLRLLRRYPQAFLVHLEISNLLKGLAIVQWVPGLAGLCRRWTGIFFKSRAWFERTWGWKKRLKHWVTDITVSRWIRRLRGAKAGFLTHAVAREYEARFPGKAMYVPDPVPSYLEKFPFDARGDEPSLSLGQLTDGEGKRSGFSLPLAPPLPPGVCWRVCLVGSQGPRKGTEFAIRALETHWKGPDRMELLVAGSCSRCPWVASHISSNPHLHLTVIDRGLGGDEFYQMVAGSHVCLTPYERHYSPSAVLLVAAYAGTPVLGTAQGQMLEEITRTGVGKVFPPNDALAFAAILEEMLQGLFTNPLKGRDILLFEHDWRAFVKAVHGLALLDEYPEIEPPLGEAAPSEKNFGR